VLLLPVLSVSDHISLSGWWFWWFSISIFTYGLSKSYDNNIYLLRCNFSYERLGMYIVLKKMELKICEIERGGKYRMNEYIDRGRNEKWEMRVMLEYGWLK
jgi:hypothetical protein